MTKRALKLLETLEKQPGKWQKIGHDQQAFDELQSRLGCNVMQFDGFTNQMRYMPKETHV